MKICVSNVDKMKETWNNTESPTAKYFINGMENGNIEFWTVEKDEDNSVIGELYIFWNSEDKDEANGENRAYLCAFRIDEGFRGKGLGFKLMKKVLERIKEKGFKEVTIGVDNGDRERLTAMYKGWGFSELVKVQHYDYHYRDENNKPAYYEEGYELYLKRL